MLTDHTRELVVQAYRAVVEDLHGAGVLDMEHLQKTPQRVLRALEDMLTGVEQDPRQVLQTAFSEQVYDEMILVTNIEFVSLCAHHLLPFQGRVHFGYLPDKRIVGLSKIPRLVEILARRPQIQERMTYDLVHIFFDTVQPLGCGAVVEASHGCVGIRGIRKPGAMMRTVALAGEFLKQPAMKAEFLAGARGDGNGKVG